MDRGRGDVIVDKAHRTVRFASEDNNNNDSDNNHHHHQHHTAKSVLSMAQKGSFSSLTQPPSLPTDSLMSSQVPPPGSWSTSTSTTEKGSKSSLFKIEEGIGSSTKSNDEMNEADNEEDNEELLSGKSMNLSVSKRDSKHPFTKIASMSFRELMGRAPSQPAFRSMLLPALQYTSNDGANDEFRSKLSTPEVGSRLAAAIAADAQARKVITLSTTVHNIKYN